jgi:hypothetical protein
MQGLAACRRVLRDSRPTAIALPAFEGLDPGLHPLDLSGNFVLIHIG